MLNNSVLDQFQFPADAIEGLQAANLKQVDLGRGASRFMSGHDKGVAFRFFTKPLYNATASKLAGYEKFDEVEMIEWMTDKYCHPTERVKFLPEALLHIDPLTGEARGRYAEAYKRYKEGKAAPGTPLEMWGVFSQGEVATLAMNSIFTVEQYAALPRDRVKGKFPPNFVEAWERAAQFVAGKENRIDADRQAAQMLEISRENAQLKSRLEALEAALTQKAAPVTEKVESTPKRRGRPKKSIPEVAEESLTEQKEK